ncbi:UBX domain-containing protein 4 [Latimeria chalumnae]|uniref:UBX domain-containing protein 4 n=1 Tax=Latimeria chalumnae TaxID=7897 RepID=H3AHI8_LATCH|nr:PREDICTED: UBX domain-containing protein 4 [Latimeria chalumnae]|eukprot:XP_006006250.1 PREDICTED: UBX domain-containing protein 4 [Latimeria chalumnae]
MLWFEGSIPAAIALAKQKNSVFVVFIVGDDDQSIQMAGSWEDEIVAGESIKDFVAIKINAKSEACVQFSEIYPVVCIPSSFFIGDNGVPLEVIAGSVSAEELINRIQKVKQMHEQKGTVHPSDGGQLTSSVATQLSPAPVDPEPVSQSQSTPLENVDCAETCASNTKAKEPRPAASKESLSKPVEDGINSAEAVGVTESEATARSSQNDDEDLDIKVERITKKLEEKREQKKKEEEQNEIRKEVERRKIGKEMLEFKKRQEQEQTKRILEERNREKAEEKAARERVKQQIAMDRAERAARYAKNKEEVEAAKAAALQARQAELEARKEAVQRERSTVARIQFRLPDGSSFTNQFPSESRLEEARRFAAQEVGRRYGNFSLATMFPRREFTKEDYVKSLLELELVPSASIVLLPAARPVVSIVQSSGGGFWAFLGTIFYPLIAVWRFVSSLLFAGPSPQPGSQGAASKPERPTPAVSKATETSREGIRKRVLEKRGEEFKKEGKIYRLRTQEDSEDDNNTWNGNSTQQM